MMPRAMILSSLLCAMGIVVCAGQSPARPSEADITKLIDDLTSNDAAISQRAADALVAAGGATIAIAEKLKPAGDPKVAPQMLAWIAQLGDENFAKREAAQRELLNAGGAAYAFCLEALDTATDAEIKMRLKQIVPRLPGPAPSPRDQRLVQVLHQIGTDAAVALANRLCPPPAVPELEAVHKALAATDNEWEVLQPRVALVLQLSNEPERADRVRRDISVDAKRPEMTALRAALAANSAPDDLKKALSALRWARPASVEEDTPLLNAQLELRKVLTIRQEAVLASMGFLQ